MNDVPAQGRHQEDVMEEHIGSATLLGHGRTAELIHNSQTDMQASTEGHKTRTFTNISSVNWAVLDS